VTMQSFRNTAVVKVIKKHMQKILQSIQANKTRQLTKEKLYLLNINIFKLFLL
jgi:hypothetical protein